jgi:hypothetical protein
VATGSKTTRLGEGATSPSIQTTRRGYRRRRAETNRNRRSALLLVVLGILAALGAMLLVGVIIGDHTDSIDPQNGKITTAFIR